MLKSFFKSKQFWNASSSTKGQPGIRFSSVFFISIDRDTFYNRTTSGKQSVCIAYIFISFLLVAHFVIAVIVIVVRWCCCCCHLWYWVLHALHTKAHTRSHCNVACTKFMALMLGISFQMLYVSFIVFDHFSLFCLFCCLVYFILLFFCFLAVDTVVARWFSFSNQKTNNKCV